MVVSACPRSPVTVMAPTIATIMLTVNSIHRSIEKEGGKEDREGGVKKEVRIGEEE